MITAAFEKAWAGFLSWFLGLWPAYTLPDWVQHPTDKISTALSSFAGFGVWIDWTLLVTVVTAVVAAYVLQLTIRLARWLLGLVPTMGGGT